MKRTRDLRLAAVALILLTVFIRLPALMQPAPIDDEAVYSVVANEIVHGGLPYVSAIERKPPLLFWTYAAVFSMAGGVNWPALHATSIAWTLATMAGLYVIARRMFDTEAGLTAALLYSLYQPWGTWKNLAFNGELLMNLPIVWGYALTLGPARSRARPELALAGALLAAAFLLKQPAAIAAVPLVCYLLLPGYRTARGFTVAQAWGQLALLTGGFAGALGLVAVVLHAQGILPEAFYWTITNHDVPHIFWTRGLMHSMAFVAACLPLLIGSVAALGDRASWRGLSAERIALGLFVLVSAIGAAASGRFYPHYYIQLVPPLALLAGFYYRYLWRGQDDPHSVPLRRSILATWLALTVVVFAVTDWYGLRGDREPSEAGRYLLERSSPDDRIFVWGQAPRIYLDAERHPASRYIATFPLTGYIFGGPVPGLDTRGRILPEAWENLAKDFKDHPPAYIVDTQVDEAAMFPVYEFPGLARLLADQYVSLTRTAEGQIYKRAEK